MKILRTVLFFACSILCASCASQKKIAFGYGKSIHYWGDHENKIMCEILSDAANAAFGEKASASAVNLDENAEFESLKKYDAIYVIAEGEDHHPFKGKSGLIKSLNENGTSFAFVHYSTTPTKNDNEDAIKDAIGGVYETYFSVNPTFEAKFEKFAKHPVSNGVKPFVLTDEIYFNIRFKDGANIAHIAKATPPDKVRKFMFGPHTGNKFVRENLGREETIAWACENPNGTRGFGLTAGHAVWALKNPDFFKIMLNSSAWLAKIEVPENGFEAKTPSAEEIEKKITKEKRPDIIPYKERWQKQMSQWQSLD